MQDAEFRYANNEWEIGPCIITADLVLFIGYDVSEGEVTGISLESVRRSDGGPVPVFVSDTMTAWVRENEEMLIRRAVEAFEGEREYV